MAVDIVKPHLLKIIGALRRDHRDILQSKSSFDLCAFSFIRNDQKNVV